ncbi:AAA domain-containing protein [Variovorax sp. J31P207]|uniref:AAA domain-containing protein n=1 Tax=Variovorax sp. J31P207 TaxID=3053510 RepID=UPI002578E299|nr:AAA domain-containing protein [Variovorax sp. J31P207]MDM0065305.1 AAA domain-containing protein [Variovorax sp. J31P207]
MACKVRYLNSAGIMPREIKGVDALAKAFPAEWLLYVALNCYPRNQDPMEIDALLVIEDQILVLEIKDWNPKLTYQNDRWFVGGQSRGRSAVLQVSEKARKLKSVLASEIPKIRDALWVEPRVVLTGQATREHLHHTEKAYVWTLAEACSITHTATRRQLLQSRRISLFKLYQFVDDFDQVLGNTKIFQPLEADWAGYRVTEEEVFRHPRGVWQDHRAERKGEPRLKALVRTWSFDSLPPTLNSGDRRRLIADRETKAFAHLTAVGSDLIERNAILREIGHSSDEILTNHFEVRALGQGWLTLDRYLEKARDDLSDVDRLLIATGLLNIVKELHYRLVSHRDLGPRSVWLSGPTSMALTGLMSCQIPEEMSVVDWLTTLRGYAPDLPEDGTAKLPSTGRQRDVYLAGYLVGWILASGPVGGTTGLDTLPDEFAFLRPWLAKALDSNPVERFPDAGTMTDEFTRLIESQTDLSFDQSLLDRHETPDIPYLRWPATRQLPGTARCSVYVSIGPDGRELTVKIWNGLARGLSSETDLALLRLLDSASRIMSAPTAALPRFICVGLSPIGPFVVYEHETGLPLDQLGSLEAAEILAVCSKLMVAVTALHDLGCDHGDIAQRNVIYDSAASKLCLIDPFDISPVGDGAVRTPTLCPPNWERLSQQAIDRSAVLRIVADLVAERTEECFGPLRETLAQEFGRPVVETLEVAVAAIHRASNSLVAPRVRSFVLTSRIFEMGTQRTEPSEYLVNRASRDQGTSRYHLTSADRQFAFEGAGDKLIRWFLNPVKFLTLAHESLGATKIKLELTLRHGPEEGMLELFEHVQSVVAVGLPAEAHDTEATPSFRVASHWQRLMDLEANDRIEVRLTREIAARDGVVVFRFQNLGKGFDFDPDDVVDVYSEGNKRIGEVDHALSDFAGTLAIRYATRKLTAGDSVYLADRREQTSIDRRSKAVRRILDGSSAIPELIDYFDPNIEAEPVDFDGQIPEDDLAAYGLNEGQNAAFRAFLASGPVGLLQGPPGTGKTRFIASFAHWLITRGGAKRILIASQSHEAVNNVIDSLVLLYKRHGNKPNLLRIGSKGITERIRPYHTAELRERYRLRFEGALGFRFSQLASAKGIPAGIAKDVVALDQAIGTLARRCAQLQLLAAQESDELAVDRERFRVQLDRAGAAFEEAARANLNRRVDRSRPLEELDEAFLGLLQKHPGASPADLTSAREILALTQDWLSSLGSPQRNFEEFLAKTRSIITATCVGVGQTRIRIDSQTFDWVIVDEAARCTPSELAVPIQLGRRVLLVGDHLQLMPMIGRELLDQLQEDRPDIPREQFITSDFERSFNSAYGRSAGQRLTEQYRMDPAICRMVSSSFYEPKDVNLLTSAARSSEFTVAADAPDWLRRPMAWIDTSEERNPLDVKLPGHTTFHNDAEVTTIVRLLESLSTQKEIVDQLARGDDESPIGIICMYSGQKSKIEMAVARHTWDAKFRRLLRIDTVDAYQGKENTIVILSLVRSNKHGEIGHVGSNNRCNVAVSRAKDRLIVVGSCPMWTGQQSASPMGRVLAFMLASPDEAKVLTSGEIE